MCRPSEGFGKFTVKYAAGKAEHQERDRLLKQCGRTKLRNKVAIADTHQKHIGNGFWNHQKPEEGNKARANDDGGIEQKARSNQQSGVLKARLFLGLGRPDHKHQAKKSKGNIAEKAEKVIAYCSPFILR